MVEREILNNDTGVNAASKNVLDYFKPVTTFIFDVDGVLTDGSVLLLENGLQARRMHVKDGLALQMALRNGYRVIVVSGAYSEPVLKRLQYLGIEEIYLAIKNKLQFLEKYKAEHGLQWQELLYMGDDLPDVPLLQEVGLSACPADAVAEVKSVSRYISGINGGNGCVRDVIEKVLRLNGHWQFETEVVSK
jgi:3-deoxy-D-manno-octulosonate 8-phosphate phosphatase (KDO 8-P phosphatase)